MDAVRTGGAHGSRDYFSWAVVAAHHI